MLQLFWKIYRKITLNFQLWTKITAHTGGLSYREFREIRGIFGLFNMDLSANFRKWVFNKSPWTHRCKIIRKHKAKKSCLVCVTKSENPASASRKLFFKNFFFVSLNGNSMEFPREFPKVFGNSQKFLGKSREFPKIGEKIPSRPKRQKKSQWGCYMQG